MRHLAFSLLLLGLSATPSSAQSSLRTSFPHPDGTTHWYEAVTVPTGVDWQEANAMAAAKGGYLATITSAAENQAVFTLIDRPEFWYLDVYQGHWSGPWVGGVQLSSAQEPAGGWGWAELEALTYTNWATGQPNDAGNADRIHFGGDPSKRDGTWNDAPSAKKLRGFVVEYSGASVPITVGLKKEEPGSFVGYTLAAPFRTGLTYLIDHRGRAVNLWNSSYAPGLSAYLMPNGDLVRTGNVNNQSFQIGGVGGLVERFDWDNKLLWSYQHSSTTYCHHHDIEVLPNGNVLMISWELKTQAEAIAAGRDPNLLPDGRLLPDKIIEVKPNGTNGGTIVWEWHAWDHLVQDHDSTKANYGDPAKHPDRIDLNYVVNGGEDDWMHSNAVAYNAKLDQIMLSVRSFDELWIIDHSTTTAEAKTGSGGRSGKGGRLLYRWGNPRAYRAGTLADQRLFKQHDTHWIPDGNPGAGNILVFNNGTDRPGGDASSADEIAPPTPDANGLYPMTNGVWGPKDPTWSYTDPNPTSFYSRFISGAQRLPNGNTLICGGWIGRTIEVTAQKEIVWEYQNPMQAGVADLQGVPSQGQPLVFRNYRYPPSYGAFTNRNLTPISTIEQYTDALLVDGSKLVRRVQPGGTVDFTLRAVNEKGKYYFLGTSMTPGLVSVDHRFLPVGYDEVLAVSLTGGLPTVFQGYFGQIDQTGFASAKFTVPNLPWLIGVDFASMYLIFDPSARSSVGKISNVAYVRVVQ